MVGSTRCSVRLRRLMVSAALVTFAALMGCTKRDETAISPPNGDDGSAGIPGGGTTAPPAGGEGKAWPAATGTIVGLVKCAAQVPRTPVVMSAKLECEALHTVDKPLSETVIVSEAGGLKDVVVYIAAGLEGYAAPPPPTEPAVLDQKGCIYVPHVFAMRVRQDLKILNSDPFLHNVHSGRYNRTMNTVGEMISKRHFKKAVVGREFTCDVHPWMSAWACAFDHPCFAVTGADGSFRIENVPPGKVQVAFWHEPAAALKPPPPVEVEVKAGEEVMVEVSF